MAVLVLMVTLYTFEKKKMHWLLFLTKLSVAKKKRNFFVNYAVINSATHRPKKKKVPGAPIPKDVAHHCFVRQWLARQLTWQHAEKDEVSRVVDFFLYMLP